MLESQYQSELIGRIEERFPGCVVLKNDEQLRQGIPDLSVLYKGRYAVLEVKPYKDAPRRPNQDWYIEKLNKDEGFASLIYPENEEDVLDAFEQTLRT